MVKNQQELGRDVAKLKKGKSGKGLDLVAALAKATNGSVQPSANKDGLRQATLDELAPSSDSDDDPDPDSEPSSSSSDSSSDESRRKKRRSKAKKKRKSAKFWTRFKKTPFPVQSLGFSDRIAQTALQRALTNHQTVSAYIESKPFKHARNKREAMNLAKAIDCAIYSLGIDEAKKQMFMEVLLRRLAAITTAERTGNWDAARELEDEGDEMLDDAQRRHLQKAAKLRKEFYRPTKPNSALQDKEQGDTA